MRYTDALSHANEDETRVHFMVYPLSPTADLSSNPDSTLRQHICEPLSAATHAYELLSYIAEADLQCAAVESLLALLFQTYRLLTHELVWHVKQVVLHVWGCCFHVTASNTRIASAGYTAAGSRDGWCTIEV